MFQYEDRIRKQILARVQGPRSAFSDYFSLSELFSLRERDQLQDDKLTIKIKTNKMLPVSRLCPGVGTLIA